LLESQKASPEKAQSAETEAFSCDSLACFPDITRPPEGNILLSCEAAYENSEPEKHQRENSQSPHPKNSLSTQLQSLESPRSKNSLSTQLQDLESPHLKNILPTQLQNLEPSQQNSTPAQLQNSVPTQLLNSLPKLLQNNESPQLENSMSSQLENNTSTTLQNSNTFFLQNSTSSEQLGDRLPNQHQNIPASPPQNHRSIRSKNSQSQLTQKNDTSPSEDRVETFLLKNSKTSPQNSELRQRKNSQSQSDDSDEFRDSLEDVNAEGETLDEDKNNKGVDFKPLDVEGESIDGKSRALKRSIHAAEDFVTKVSHRFSLEIILAIHRTLLKFQQIDR
jgi:hypothetical protein